MQKNTLGANYSASPRPARHAQEPVQAEAPKPTMQEYLPAVGMVIVLDSGDVIRRPERGLVEYEHMVLVLGKRAVKTHRYTVAAWMGRDARKMATVQRVVAASMGSRSSLLAQISLLAREAPGKRNIAEYISALTQERVCSKEHAQALGLLWYLAEYQGAAKKVWGGEKFSLADREQVARIRSRLEQSIEKLYSVSEEAEAENLLAGLETLAGMGV